MSATESTGRSGQPSTRPEAGTGPVILLCTTTRDCPRTLERALTRARETGRGLLATFVLDPALLSATASLLSQAGFDANERGAADLEPAYRARAEERLAAIAEAARAAGVEVRTELREGDFVVQLREALKQEGPCEVICARKRRSHYARLVFEKGLLEPVREQIPIDEVEEA